MVSNNVACIALKQDLEHEDVTSYCQYVKVARHVQMFMPLRMTLFPVLVAPGIFPAPYYLIGSPILLIIEIGTFWQAPRLLHTIQR